MLLTPLSVYPVHAIHPLSFSSSAKFPLHLFVVSFKLLAYCTRLKEAICCTWTIELYELVLHRIYTDYLVFVDGSNEIRIVRDITDVGITWLKNHKYQENIGPCISVLWWEGSLLRLTRTMYALE